VVGAACLTGAGTLPRMSPNPLNRSTDTDGAARPQRPSTVDKAVYALIARCVFSVLSALTAYGARPEISDALAKANRSKNWTSDQLRSNVDSYLRDTVITVLILAVLVLVIAKLLRDGRNWARWLYVVFAVLLTGDVQHVLGFIQYDNLLLRLTNGLTGVAAVAALVLMFLPQSNAYLRPAGGSGGLLGSLLGPRPPRVRPADDSTSGAPTVAEPTAVRLTKPATKPATKPVIKPAGNADPPEAPSNGKPAEASRRPPRAKSRKQPSE
jgi:hypothetical protein